MLLVGVFSSSLCFSANKCFLMKISMVWETCFAFDTLIVVCHAQKWTSLLTLQFFTSPRAERFFYKIPLLLKKK